MFTPNLLGNSRGRLPHSRRGHGRGRAAGAEVPRVRFVEDDLAGDPEAGALASNGQGPPQKSKGKVVLQNIFFEDTEGFKIMKSVLRWLMNSVKSREFVDFFRGAS